MAPDSGMEHSGDPIGHVSVVYGSASALTGGDTRALVKGDPVYLGEDVVTGPESAVEITFLDDTVLSQTQNSRVNLDTYVFDPDTGAGDVLLKLTQGTFRMATGAIVDQNPDKFKVQSPLATIGIRGTDTGHVVPGLGSNQPENHSCLQYDDHPVVIQSNMGGPPQTLFGAGLGVPASPMGLGGIGSLTGAQMGFFNTMSPGSMAGGPPASPRPPSSPLRLFRTTAKATRVIRAMRFLRVIKAIRVTQATPGIPGTRVIPEIRVTPATPAIPVRPCN